MSWVNSIRFFVMFHLTIPAKPGRQPPLVPRLPPDITSAKTYPQHRSQKAVNGQGSWRVSLKWLNGTSQRSELNWPRATYWSVLPRRNPMEADPPAVHRSLSAGRAKFWRAAGAIPYPYEVVIVGRLLPCELWPKKAFGNPEDFHLTPRDRCQPLWLQHGNQTKMANRFYDSITARCFHICMITTTEAFHLRYGQLHLQSDNGESQLQFEPWRASFHTGTQVQLAKLQY